MKHYKLICTDWLCGSDDRDRSKIFEYALGECASEEEALQKADEEIKRLHLTAHFGDSIELVFSVAYLRKKDDGLCWFRYGTTENLKKHQ